MYCMNLSTRDLIIHEMLAFRGGTRLYGHKTYQYDYCTRIRKQPIGTRYPVVTVIWLDDIIVHFLKHVLVYNWYDCSLSHYFLFLCCTIVLFPDGFL